MLFNTVEFFCFLAVVLVAYHRLGARGQNGLLLVASYVFYAWWDWRFVGLLLLSTVVDFLVSRALASAEDERRRRHLLALSVVVNLGVLFTFKYAGFFVDSFTAAMGRLGLDVGTPSLRLILPVGISFYTFQTLGYTVDVYRRRLEPARSLLEFALFVSFFPQLVAGPIERAERLLPQFRARRSIDHGRVVEGTSLILIGLVKKVVIADNAAAVANTVFAPGADPTGPEVLVGLYAFALQIYGDFSGYSSIARGVAKWFGIDLMLNFWVPYASRAPDEFWRRWHISLSQWFADYLYIPLGGNRVSTAVTYRNLMVTMILAGLWHGAAWTFALWGAYHGALLVAQRLWQRRHPPVADPSWPRRIVGTVLMFQLTCLGWLLFRAQSIGQVGSMLEALVRAPELTSYAVGAMVYLMALALPLLVLEVWQLRFRWLPDPLDPPPLPVPSSPVRRGVLYGIAVLLLVVLAPAGTREFIYFRF